MANFNVRDRFSLSGCGRVGGWKIRDINDHSWSALVLCSAAAFDFSINSLSVSTNIRPYRPHIKVSFVQWAAHDAITSEHVPAPIDTGRHALRAFGDEEAVASNPTNQQSEIPSL